MSTRNLYLQAFLALIFSTTFTLTSIASDNPSLTKAWTAFHNNQRKTAQTLFTEASTSSDTKAEAYLGLAMLAWGEENNERAFSFIDKFYDAASNPFPELYALWSTGAMFDGFAGKKTAYQLSFLNKLLQDKRLNGTMRAMAIAAIGDHYLYSAKPNEALTEFNKIGALSNWQVLGTFENTSASGFNKDFNVLEHPESKAVFKNKIKTNISWFKPPVERSDKWFDFTYLFEVHNAIMYAQTFLNSLQDQEVIMRSGCSGSIKIWVNDQLITNEITERNCDLDIYANTVQLKKGYNRILVQIGESESGRANFLIRLTDKQGNTIQGLSTAATQQDYPKASIFRTESIPFFAEAYFENQIKNDPNTILNYILLAETYLRNDKAYESRKYLKKARELAPESTFLSGVLVEAYSREGNKTELTKEGEFIKTKDPESFVSMQLLLAEALGKEDFAEAELYLTKIKNEYGESSYTDFTELGILAKQQKYDPMIQLSDKLYKKYPDNFEAVNLAYVIEQEIKKSPKTAQAVLKKYVSNTYSDKALLELAKVSFQNGKKEEGFAYYQARINNFPYAIGYYDDMAEQYFGVTDYKNALIYRLKVLDFAPYYGTYWKKLAETYNALNQKEKAIEAYKKAIELEPTLFAAHKALRTLENKPDLFSHFPKTNADLVFKTAAKADKYPNDNSLILINETQRVVYPQGTTEERDEILTKILTQQGIDEWKEFTIPFNENSQNYIVEKAEVLKANGSKVKAESNENQLVFTGLEVGDAIHVVYRLEDLSSGMLGQHFNDKILFALGYPSTLVRYSLLMPENKPFQFKTNNVDIKPTIKQLENFKLYTWEQTNQAAIIGESMMPTLNDIAPVLEVSTMPDWNFIGQWYSDLASTKAKSDFEVQETVRELFKEQPKNLSDLAKAKIIYNYIENNINYLSVAFMQSGIVPQKASRTLSTKLGDCKDLSTLFVAMCNEVGVKANLVLVSTRDNGDNNMLLPSINFNHCIATLDTEGTTYFIELTDNKNSFGSLSPLLTHTNILKIPREGETFKTNLSKLSSNIKSVGGVYRQMALSLNQKDITAKIVSLKTGSIASGSRHANANLSPEEREKAIGESLSADFSSVLKVNHLTFFDLEKRSDSLNYEYEYFVKNALSEVAGMKILSLPWSDKIKSSDFITAETRKMPFLLWEFLEAQEMKETIVCQIPAGKKLLEVPENIHLSTDFADFEMSFDLKGDKLYAKRALIRKKDIISPNEYPAFREFFNKVIEADTKQLAIK